MTGSLDLHRFEAHLAHFDNPNAGEAGNNFRAALKMCRDENLRFMDGCKLLFADTGQNAQLRSDIETLKTRLAQSEAEAVTLAERYQAAQDRAEHLEAQANKRLDRAEGLRGYFTHAWGLAGFRLVLAGAVFQAWFWLVPHMLNPLAVNVSASSLGLVLLWEWITLEYLAHGPLQLLMRGLLLLGGLTLLLFYVHDDLAASIAAALLTFFTISKFTERLAYEVARLVAAAFENRVLAAVKGWLV